MKAPVSWIAEYAALPAGTDGRTLGEALIRAGLEVESVETLGGDITGPLVIGRVVDFVEEPQKNGRVIRWCHVDVGAEHAPDAAPEPVVGGIATTVPSLGHHPRGVVCGATNFAPGDVVVVALPGCVLPGGFAIATRKTYGHVSDGMICAVDELGLGDDHSGIWVLGDAAADSSSWVLGADALGALGVRDDVLDMPVTPDMGYCLSIRGLAREAAQALDVPFTDPVRIASPGERADGFGVRLETPTCPQFVALTVSGVDPSAPTPAWLAARLQACGMRSISLAVDISNYVMLEFGQPNHCYDADALRGGIVVRQALPQEHLVTLDGVDRALHPEDIVIADAEGPIGLAGVMGGERTELSASTTRIVIEAATFDPIAIARTSRRHKLSSEASKRFERSVDAGMAYAAAQRVAELLVELAGGTLEAAETVAGSVPAMPEQTIRASLPTEVLGMAVPAEQVVTILERSGVRVRAEGDLLHLLPPTWRPDLVDPYDYVEEVGTKVGLDALPSIVPAAPVGGGLTREQRLRRAINRALATAGFVEVLSFPFVSEGDLDDLGLGGHDPRRATVRLANPLADTAPLLRTTLLPGLVGAVQRNTSRGHDDLALFEAGHVFWAREPRPAPMPAVTARPSAEEIEALDAALADQPRLLAAMITGSWRRAGWQGAAEPAGWTHALAFADAAAAVVGCTLTRRAASQAPWHPGRCAELLVGDVVVGYAGEVHPSVCASLGLPPRTSAAELNLDLLVSLSPGPGAIAAVSSRPVAKEDIALIVDESVAVGALTDVVAAGAGELLESVRLFDIYRGVPVPPGKKSCAFALRFRAADRTLKDVEIAAARDGAVAAAAAAFGAELRA